jgi:hypothetical protein
MLLLGHCAPRVLCAMGLILAGAATGSAETLRGWVSDEQCARGRASDGTYTGTNPDCAKKCIANGTKTVLIDSDHKRILVVENPAAVKENIGDYVEVQGSLESGSDLVRVSSIKMIEKGSAMCGRTSHRPAKPSGK